MSMLPLDDQGMPDINQLEELAINLAEKAAAEYAKARALIKDESPIASLRVFALRKFDERFADLAMRER